MTTRLLASPAALLGLLLLTGCGTGASEAPEARETPEAAGTPTAATSAPAATPTANPSPTSPPTSPPTPTPPPTVTATPSPTATAAPWQLVEILTGAAAGGRVSSTAVRLDDEAAVADFVSQLTRPSLAEDLVRAAGQAEVPAGSALYAAVVAVGCDVPPGVRVDVGPGGVVVTGTRVKAPPVQCLVPTTSVALVTAEVG